MPKPQKSSKIEKERRIKFVLAWILADALEHEIIDQCKVDFNVQERMARYYIKEARKRVWEIESDDLDQQIEMAVAKRKKLIRSLGKQHKDTPQGVRTILKIEDSISKLKGHFVKRVDITTKGKPINPDPNELPNLSVEQILELLDARNK